MIFIDYLSVLRRRFAVPELSGRTDVESGHKCGHYTIFSFIIKLFYYKTMSFFLGNRKQNTAEHPEVLLCFVAGTAKIVEEPEQMISDQFFDRKHESSRISGYVSEAEL